MTSFLTSSAPKASAQLLVQYVDQVWWWMKFLKHFSRRANTYRSEISVSFILLSQSPDCYLHSLPSCQHWLPRENTELKWQNTSNLLSQNYQTINEYCKLCIEMITTSKPCKYVQTGWHWSMQVLLVSGFHTYKEHINVHSLSLDTRHWGWNDVTPVVLV